jgi:hypothetical protein
MLSEGYVPNAQMMKEGWPQFGFQRVNHLRREPERGFLRGAQERADAVVEAGHDIVAASAPVDAVSPQTAIHAAWVGRFWAGKVVLQRSDLHQVPDSAD